MRNGNEFVKRLTLSLCVMIAVCLGLAALGGVFEAVLLIYCWYLALFGIAAVIVLTALLAVNMLFNALSRRYHRILQQWDGGSCAQRITHQIQH